MSRVEGLGAEGLKLHGPFDETATENALAPIENAGLPRRRQRGLVEQNLGRAFG